MDSSHIFLVAPIDLIVTKFGLVAYFVGIINCAIFPLFRKQFDFVDGGNSIGMMCRC